MLEKSLLLSLPEVEELTQARRRKSQISALCQMGIEHKVRPDGSIAVLRKHVEEILSGREYSTRRERNSEPDWTQVK